MSQFPVLGMGVGVLPAHVCVCARMCVMNAWEWLGGSLLLLPTQRGELPVCALPHLAGSEHGYLGEGVTVLGRMGVSVLAPRASPITAGASALTGLGCRPKPGHLNAWTLPSLPGDSDETTFWLKLVSGAH